MTVPRQEPFSGPVEAILAARVARMHYLEDRSKVQIADELGVTRFKVARLLELARTSGLVRISVDGVGAREVELARRLRDELGLRHAVVTQVAQGRDETTRDQLGAAAARLVAEVSTDADVLGIGWARVVLAMAAHLRDLRVSRVVQLTGALSRPDVEPSSVDVVRIIARGAGAPSSVFYAPMVVGDEQTAQGLHREAAVAEAVARFATVTRAVVGVGGWDPPSSTLHDALDPADQAVMRESGVCADLSGVLLDARGEAVETPISRRIIGITASQLRAVPEVVGIAYGLDKVPAAAAGIRGGYLDSLVTHTEFAHRLLEQAD